MPTEAFSAPLRVLTYHWCSHITNAVSAKTIPRCTVVLRCAPHIMQVKQSHTPQGTGNTYLREKQNYENVTLRFPDFSNNILIMQHIGRAVLNILCSCYHQIVTPPSQQHRGIAQTRTLRPRDMLLQVMQ